MKEAAGAILIGLMIGWYGRFFWVYIIRPELQARPLRRMTRLELWVQRQRHKFAQYDLERLAWVGLVCVIVLSGIWSLIFKGVTP